MILKWFKRRRQQRALLREVIESAESEHSRLSLLVNGGIVESDGKRTIHYKWLTSEWWNKQPYRYSPYPRKPEHLRVCQRMADRALMWKTRARDPLRRELYARLERRFLIRAGWDVFGSVALPPRIA